MENKLGADLSFVRPGKQDKVNALFSVLLWRNMMNCPREVQDEFYQGCLAKMRNRLSQLIMWTKEPCLEIILQENLTDTVKTVSTNLYKTFGAAKYLLQAAMASNRVFESHLMKSLTKELGVKKRECVYSLNFTVRNPWDNEPENPNAVFLALLIKNVLNSSKAAGRSLPLGAHRTIVQRLYQVITHCPSKTSSGSRPQVQQMELLAERISKDIFNEYGNIQKLLHAALDLNTSFDALLLGYLQTHLKIKEPHGIWNKIVSGISSGLDRISIGFYQMHTRWQVDQLPTVVPKQNTLLRNNQEVG